MKVLLIYIEPLDNEPIGLMYIGTVLENDGHFVKIIGIHRNHSERRLLKEISHFKPEVIGISIPTPLANKAQEIASIIKSSFPNITIIAGGPHPTILPYETLKQGRIDICVIGEGEETVIDLLGTLMTKQSLENVEGIAFIKEGNPVITKPRDYIQDLDSLPFVNRTLVPKDVIYGRAGYPLGNPCMLLMTVRGCPYRCSFCQPTVDKIFGKKVRKRSPENVINEIIELKKKYHINGIWINDDTFLFDNVWIDKFCNLIIEKKINITWYANGRINNADKNILIRMRDAGCVGVVLTPETGSQRIRDDILNKKIHNEEIINAYEVCHEIGLPAQANIMLGSPTETEKDLELSAALIKRIQPHFMNFSYTTALPGTYLYEKYSKEISGSSYYQNYGNYDIGVFKKLNSDIDDWKLIAAWNYFKKLYSNVSFSNRARHFFRFPYFRRILFKRWKSLVFSRHPKFRHFFFDILAITMGSFLYIKNRRLYDEG